MGRQLTDTDDLAGTRSNQQACGGPVDRAIPKSERMFAGLSLTGMKRLMRG